MARDSNRGRDLPRGPQHVPMKQPKDPAVQADIERMNKIGKVKKALAKMEMRRGFDDLLASPRLSNPKVEAKEREDILLALKYGVPVHPKLLAEFNLEAEPNPKAPDIDAGRAPFGKDDDDGDGIPV